jgi:hypothetical protein
MSPYFTGVLSRGMKRFGFALILAAAAAILTFPGQIPAFADSPQSVETPGLIHGTTPPPTGVNVQSLEPAPPVDETTPPRKIRSHVRDQKQLERNKKLLEEGLIKPQTDVIEDSGNSRSTGKTK